MLPDQPVRTVNYLFSGKLFVLLTLSFGFRFYSNTPQGAVIGGLPPIKSELSAYLVKVRLLKSCPFGELLQKRTVSTQNYPQFG